MPNQAAFDARIWEAIVKVVGHTDAAFGVDGLVGVLPTLKGLADLEQKRMIEETLVAVLAEGHTTLIQHDKKTWRIRPTK